MKNKKNEVRKSLSQNLPGKMKNFQKPGILDKIWKHISKSEQFRTLKIECSEKQTRILQGVNVFRTLQEFLQ